MPYSLPRGQGTYMKTLPPCGPHRWNLSGAGHLPLLSLADCISPRVAERENTPGIWIRTFLRLCEAFPPRCDVHHPSLIECNSGHLRGGENHIFNFSRGFRNA